MGFSLHGYGNIHSCWLSDGYVWYTDGCGIDHNYKCTLDVNVPVQCNIFASVLVLFYLEDKDTVYIGRKDGQLRIKHRDRIDIPNVTLLKT